MILTFSLDKLIPRIISGIKKHSIREDKFNRWVAGRVIHFWKGNPRNPSVNPYQFGIGIVDYTERIIIDPKNNWIMTEGKGSGKGMFLYRSQKALNRLAVNDGFDDWKEMKTFFTERFKGKKIYWKNFREVGEIEKQLEIWK